MNYFYVYILLCSDDSYYTGHTDNLERRLSEHQSGNKYGHTFNRLPIKLVYSEAFSTRDEAWLAERKIKRWTRAKKEILIKYGWQGFEQLKLKS